MFVWLLSLFFLTSPLQAQDLNGSFLEGVTAYESKDFKKAEEIFKPLFEEYPNNPTILYNLGLVQYQKGNFGLALGLWRKARFIDQDFSEAEQAINFTEERLFPDKEENPVYVTVFNVFASLPLQLWFIISFLSLLFGGWMAVEYGVKRRLSLGHWPASVYLSLPIFIFSCFFSIYLGLDHSKQEATVIEKNLQTRANPSPDSPSLSELDEGQIVNVETQIGQWVRIRTRRGALGWVPEKSVLIFKGF